MSMQKPERVEFLDGKVRTPSFPVVGYIEGDGTGPDIWKASQAVLDAAVEHAYGQSRKIMWKELLAGEKAHQAKGVWLPDETLEEIAQIGIAIKGPLTTPVGGGIRSLNVAMRQSLDLYACVRPVRYFTGVPSPMRHPERVNMVIFRENTEDVYAGIEWSAQSPEANRVIAFLNGEMRCNIHEGSAIGIKPMSAARTDRLVRKAILYALERRLPSVTLVHKGNIMKFTEGGFREWGYALAKREFGSQTLTEKEVTEQYKGKVPPGKIVIKDRIADNMFQQALLRPEEYSVLATPNLNGDYLSDAVTAQVGGLGIAPGANIGDKAAVFEATHGTAPKYAGQDKVNPGSVILSGVMMLEFLGWNEAAEVIERALEKTILQKTVTYDFARQMEGASEVSCSEFGRRMVHNFT